MLGWTNDWGTDHNFSNSFWPSNDDCRHQTRQRASGVGTRDHGRLRAGTYINGLGYVSAFPVHYEVLDEYCGNHEVITFNGSRDAVAQSFRDAGYRSSRTYVGNTIGFAQPCTGRVVRSDGYIDRLRT